MKEQTKMSLLDKIIDTLTFNSPYIAIGVGYIIIIYLIHSAKGVSP